MPDIDIRYSVAGDLPALAALWDVCFPGEEGFRAYYFSRVWQPGYTLVQADGEGLVAAMLHLLPVEVCVGGAVLQAAYVYAVGTAPEYRRRGLAGELLEQAFFELHLRSIPLALTIPQDEKLSRYYAGYGFATVYTPPVAAATSLSMRGTRVTESDLPALCTLYSAAMGGRAHVRRSPEDFGHILAEAELAGGGILITAGGNGYTVYEREGEGLKAREDSDNMESRMEGMMRVIDARACFGALSLELPPSIEDECCPWNNRETEGEPPVGERELCGLLLGGAELYLGILHN